jgi:peptidyl-tRNA hydrolase, PTH2 family
MKQVIVIRKDLNMRKGKMVAQGSHASLNSFLRAQECIASSSEADSLRLWRLGFQTKICVSVDSEQELLEIHKKAQEAGLPCHLVQDAALTEFKEPTLTSCGIGPCNPEDIDKITGKLKLL